MVFFGVWRRPILAARLWDRKGIGGGGGRLVPRDHALFPVVAFDVDGPGHSERLIENFLRLWNGTGAAMGLG